MHHKIVHISLQYRFFVILGILGICILGVYQYNKLPVDAFPDISPIMVPVFAEAHGMAPEEVERLITFPIESAMNGLPGVRQVKSTSAFGMAVVYVYFEDDTDIYFARQIVSERLNEAVSQMPEMHEAPTLGPISTGLGQIFIYYLTMDEDGDTEGKDAVYPIYEELQGFKEEMVKSPNMSETKRSSLIRKLERLKRQFERDFNYTDAEKWMS